MAEENINFDLKHYQDLLNSLLIEEVGIEELKDDDIPNLRKALRQTHY